MPVRIRAMLILFVGIWLAANAYRIYLLPTPLPYMVYVERAADAPYPEVKGYRTPKSKEETHFQLGDRVRRVGSHDLRGKAQFEFLLALGDEVTRTRGPIPVEVERQGRVEQWLEPLPDHQPTEFATSIFGSIVGGIVAILLLVRAKPSHASRALFLALAASAFLSSSVLYGPTSVGIVGYVYAMLVICVFMPIYLRAFLSFPEETGSYRGIHRYWPWLFAPGGVVIFSGVNGFPLPFEPSRTISSAISGLWITTVMVIVGVNYRRSGPIGRRQIKWVALSVWLSAIVVIGTLPWVGIADSDAPLWTVLLRTVAAQTFPVMLLIAAVRQDLFDIDRLLGATLSYNLLALVVVGSLLTFIPSATAAMTSKAGVDPTLGRTVITIVIAGLVIAAERRLRPQVDRIFFKERFALEHAMKEMPEKFNTVRRADDLWKLTGSELVEHLRPSTCVIYVSAGASFVPLFTHGDALPPQLGTDTPFVDWIRSAPVARLVDRTKIKKTDALAQAIISDMGTQVVLPVMRAGELEAFVCIGEKKSGDIYTQTDLTLLTAVSKTLSSHMLRFDEAELLERAKDMQARMRRYVPGAVAEAIALGADLETGEREVSVLFVDMRGYTAYADGRETTDIFSTVNRYTETVSKIVTDCGGVVVEFNGDGMMAVFGAPRPLEHKEASAVRAARRLVAEVPLMARSDANAPAMSVGVGIATGLAFVGNIEATDRTIWSAIGSTTNLAARLQTLTRELKASVLIDSTTYARAGSDAADLTRHPDVTIRGRKVPETLYALPLPAEALAGATPRT